jgi:hypothetical protein
MRWLALAAGVAALLGAGAGAAARGVEADLSGYVVHYVIRQENPPPLRAWFGVARQTWSDFTRIRLRPTLAVGPSARVVLEYEMDGLYAATGAVTSPGRARRQTFPWKATLVSRDDYWIEHYIDRLYLRWDLPWGRAVLGRQRISWGTGRVWNPTDFFNPINPADAYKVEKDGADALSVKAYLGDFTDLELVANAEGGEPRWNTAARLRTNWRGYDLSLVGGRVDGEWVAGGDLAGNLGRAGLRAEWAWRTAQERWGVEGLQAVVGVDHQLHPRLYGLLEYHYNGPGAAESDAYDVGRLLRSEILNLARNYLFLRGEYQLHPLLLLGLGVNANLDDASGFLLGTLAYSAGENTQLVLAWQRFWGPEGSEYALYPTAVFLQGEWNF